MKKIETFKFDVSLTSKGFNKNNLSQECNNLIFITETLDLKEFNEKIKKGYTYTAVLNRNKWNYKGTNKKELFKETSIISIDLDNIKEEIKLNDLLDYLKFTPSYCYTSTNHGKRKENEIKSYSRFRLIYLIDEPIKEINIYNKIQEEILKGFNKLIYDNTKRKDNSHKDITRIYCGNNTNNFDCIITNLIYSIDDFKLNNLESNKDNKEKKENKKTNKEIYLKLDKSILNDFMRFDYLDFINQHFLKFDIITEQQGRYNEEGYFLADYPDMKRNRFKIHKDGEMRRKTLWEWAQYRKVLKPNISIEEQLFNIVYDVCNYMDNEDGQLNKYEILNNILLSAIKYKPTFKSNRKYIKTDKEMCKELNTTPTNLIKQIKHKWKWDLIKKNYNKDLSLRKNLSNINALGLILPTGENVSLSINTLRKWIEENKELSINEHNNFKDYQHEENKEIIEENIKDSNKHNKIIKEEKEISTQCKKENIKNISLSRKKISKDINKRLYICGNESKEELEIIYENRKKWIKKYFKINNIKEAI